MKYLTCLFQNSVTIAEQAVPKVTPGEMIVRLTMCGVCGTDVSKVFGAYPKPQKLGHEVVGIVHEADAGITGFNLGQRVALAHHVPDPQSHYSRHGSETMDPQFKTSNIDPGGFAEFIHLSPLHVANTVVAIPDHVPETRAVFMEPLGCCIHVLSRVKFVKDDSALIVGAGAIGILFVPLLISLGVIVLATDTRDDRVAVAKQWGAVVGDANDDIPSLCKSRSESRGVDAVILTVVNKATIILALASVRDGGTIVFFGGKPGDEMTMPVWEIWLREINLVSSYSTTPQELRLAMQHLSGHAFEGIEQLISHTLTLSQAQQAFELVNQGKASKVVITPDR
jgi:L-iditol 2-dehydrogenase